MRPAPHLTTENADELAAAATHKTKAEIQQLIAERFPRTESLPLVQPIPAASCAGQLVPAPVGVTESERGTRSQLVSKPAAETNGNCNATPIAAQRFSYQITLDQEGHDLMSQARSRSRVSLVG